jgi:hypothetical protein
LTLPPPILSLALSMFPSLENSNTWISNDYRPERCHQHQ